MSDDLIEKLYDRRVCSPAQNSCRNDWLLNQCRDRIEEMEAKLAKAVEALSAIEGWSNNPRIGEFASETIAELTGGKDE